MITITTIIIPLMKTTRKELYENVEREKVQAIAKQLLKVNLLLDLDALSNATRFLD